MKSKSKSQEIKVTNVKKVNTPTLDEIEAEKIKIQPVGYPFNFNLLDATPLEISDEKLFEEYAKEQWLGLEVKKNSYLFDQKIIPDYGFKIIEAQPDNSIITEKTAGMEADGKYAFKVLNKANKTEVKQAIEKKFNVKVKSVNISNSHPKKKRVGKYTGMTNKYKKAIVTLEKGSTISFD